MAAEGIDPELDHPGTTYRTVRWPEDLETVRKLFVDYRDWLADHRDPNVGSESRVQAGLALTDRLIAELPGSYGPPRGEVMLWFRNDSLVACGALRELEPKVGEVKRIFIRPDHRGGVFGPRYVRVLKRRARELGYDRLRVDTLGSMQGAIDFYTDMGFVPIPAFWPHPAEGALFFECDISRER